MDISSFGGCFVSRTLVHTKGGLRSIEQIRVGDYVLSKPENGQGEACYRRVVNTFEYDEREVWYFAFAPLEHDEKTTGKVEFLYVTPGHPFWVKGLRYTDTIEPFSGWVGAEALRNDYAEASGFALFELADGRTAIFRDAGAILKTGNPAIGLVHGNSFQYGTGIGIDFSKHYPEPLYNDKGRFKELEMDLPEDENYGQPGAIETVIGRYYPSLRKVYNLEVEDNHTYFVSNAGVLVHTTQGTVCAI